MLLIVFSRSSVCGLLFPFFSRHDDLSRAQQKKRMMFFSRSCSIFYVVHALNFLFSRSCFCFFLFFSRSCSYVFISFMLLCFYLVHALIIVLSFMLLINICVRSALSLFSSATIICATSTAKERHGSLVHALN